MSVDKARDILDCFLFENIINNRIPDERNWDITYIGNDFLVLHRDSGVIYNFEVIIGPGSLSMEDIKQAVDDQEWFDYDEEFKVVV